MWWMSHLTQLYTVVKVVPINLLVPCKYVLYACTIVIIFVPVNFWWWNLHLYPNCCYYCWFMKMFYQYMCTSRHGMWKTNLLKGWILIITKISRNFRIRLYSRVIKRVPCCVYYIIIIKRKSSPGNGNSFYCQHLFFYNWVMFMPSCVFINVLDGKEHIEMIHLVNTCISIYQCKEWKKPLLEKLAAQFSVIATLTNAPWLFCGNGINMVFKMCLLELNWI